LFDYLLANSQLLVVGQLEKAMDQFLTDVDYRYDQRNIDPLRPLLAPNELWLRKDELFAHFKTLPQVQLTSSPIELRAGRMNAQVQPLPVLAVEHQNKEPLAALRQFSEQFTGKIIFSVESEGRREALLELLQRIKLRPQSQNDFSLACQQTEKYSLVLGSAERGFIYGDNQVALICESDLLGDRVIQRRRKKDRKNVTNSDAVIRNLAELKPGHPVVHIDHGIGRYLGLQTLEAGGMVSEYVMLEYQNEAKLYVPVSSLNLISRYSGGAEEAAQLHK
ncbi:CarD family transcriptional regulator, partial [Vibrio parahaemolyticus]|nr:CarD family transcriptional regulator [Vibrio parahaemolyticus]